MQAAIKFKKKKKSAEVKPKLWGVVDIPYLYSLKKILVNKYWYWSYLKEYNL